MNNLEPFSPDDAKAAARWFGSLGGRSRSARKLAAAKSNLRRIKLTTAQRKANAVKGRLSKEQYSENARRAWARRRAEAVNRNNQDMDQ